MGWAAGIWPMQITVCLQLYNTASINQSSARDPSILFSLEHVKQIQSTTVTTLSVRQIRLIRSNIINMNSFKKSLGNCFCRAEFEHATGLALLLLLLINLTDISARPLMLSTSQKCVQCFLPNCITK